MIDSEQPFSRRHGIEAEPAPITVRYEATADLRRAIIHLLHRAGLRWKGVVEVLTDALLVSPRGNWGEDYLREEAEELIDSAPWYKVYDVAEEAYRSLEERTLLEVGGRTASEFLEDELNRFFVERGIGWRMEAGRIEFRGPEALEEVTAKAIDGLEVTGRETSARELREALRDLSRRPDPDLTGAVQHALAALECAARDFTGDSGATFGKLMASHPDLFPKPLDAAMTKLWGYASEFARHLQEGRTPSSPEAVFVVGLVSAATSFLVEKEGVTRGS